MRQPVYNVLLVLHILAVVVGFGSSFVWPTLAAKARALSPQESYAVNHTGLGISKYLTTYPIYAAIGFGVLVALAGNGDIKWTSAWIVSAIVLSIVAVLFAAFVHVPNIEAMDGLSEKLATGNVTPSPGGPPAEVLEIQERGKKAGMNGGILHVIFLLLVIDMVFKPFS